MGSSAGPRQDRETGVKGRLTPALSSLVGREREMATAMALLRREDIRLLTLTGAGGTGKTRLALEVASRLQSDFADGARLISFASVRRTDLVAAMIAKILSPTHVQLVTDPDLLISTLPDMHMLLVLDNFEHLLDAAPVVMDVLRACPGLKALVTSRTLLRVSGEHALAVPPLDLPAIPRNLCEHVDTAFELSTPGGPSEWRTSATSVGHIPESAAVRLFVDRAQAIAPSFRLTADIAPIVAEICHRLDGLPLAIELAASQVALLPPVALLARITAGLPLPFGGPRDAPDRQRTMHNTIAWSYALLNADQQRLFRRISVFVDGFQLEAAEMLGDILRVADAEDAGSSGPGHLAPEPDTLAGLATLVDMSLLKHSWDDAARFTLLETIRAFALEQLTATGERDAVCDAHADWCLNLAEQYRMALIMPHGEKHLVLLEREHGNIRAALNWLDQKGDGDRLLRMTVTLSGFYYEHNHFHEGCRWLERALALAPGTPTTLSGQAQVHLGLLLSLLHDSMHAREHLDQGVEVLRQSGDIAALTMALIWQGSIERLMGEYDRAEQALEEALGLAPLIPDESSITMTARVLSNLGSIAHARNNHETAILQHEMALRLCRKHGYVLGTIRALDDLGDIARDQGDAATSLARYQECLTLMGDRGDLRVIAGAIEGIALAAASWGHDWQAARLLGAMTALREAAGIPILGSTQQAAHERLTHTVQAKLSGHDLETAFAAGRQLTLADALAEVLAMSPPDDTGHVADDSHLELSPREVEILTMVAQGSSDRDVADALFLSVRTVEAHMSRIRARLGVRTRAAAVTTAIAAGIIHPTPSSPK